MEYSEIIPEVLMQEHLLSISNLSVEYQTVEGVVYALNGVNLNISKGESVGLVGETGAGKTTTALSIMQLVPDPPGVITSGTVKYNNRNLIELSDRELQKLRGNQISMIFQNPMASLNPVMSIGDQIVEVFKRHQKLNNKESKKRAAQMLNVVGISKKRIDEYPHEFSGGMQQRVSIAIALACQPNLLIADEPTTALDVTIQAQVLELMKELKRELTSALLLITHDLGIVAENCDRVAIMYAGTVVEDGLIETILKKPYHPYTIGLFNSVPLISKRVTRLKPISGMSPDSRRLPQGCVFHPRCPDKMDICEKKCPEFTNIKKDHGVMCWKYYNREKIAN